VTPAPTGLSFLKEQEEMTSKQVVAAALMSAVLAPQVARRAEASQADKALALRWAGYVDTGTDFSDFFGQNHTLVARFMPPYPRAYAGPIITVDDGSGSFVLSQATYNGETRLGLRVGSVSLSYPYSLLAEGGTTPGRHAPLGPSRVRVVPLQPLRKWPGGLPGAGHTELRTLAAGHGGDQERMPPAPGDEQRL
jgi:hypothetical protein